MLVKTLFFERMKLKLIFFVFVQVYNNLSGDELAELRATLQYGIEAVRGVGSPKIDLIILLKLGQIFNKRAQSTTKAVERGFYEARTEALYKFSLYMLRMQNSSRSAIEPFRRLFKYAVAQNNFEIDTEINSLAEEAITFLAGRYFKNNEFEECIEDLAGIKLPFATYFQAESYRKMTEVSNTPKKNKRAYLDKAKDYLAQTLDLLDAPNVDKNHPLKTIVETDIRRLQMESRKLETNQSMTDSFVSANGRSDLNESIETYQRQSDVITVPQANNNETIERLIRQVMESLTILKDDVADVRIRVQGIEEQLSKEPAESVSIDPNDDYYLLDDYQPNQNLTNSSMAANVSRNQTPQFRSQNMYPNQQQQQQQQNANLFGQQAPLPAGLNSPYNVNSLYNNLYSQMQYPQYQNMMASLNRSQSGQVQPNFSATGPGHLSYANDLLNANYNLHQQLATQQMVHDTRNPNLMGLLQQPMLPAQPPLEITMPQQQQQQQPQLGHSFGMPNPLNTSNMNTSASINTSTLNTPQTLPAASNQMAPAIEKQQTPIQKQWNSTFNNTPVEKGPPVNVVITSSDPLPAQNVVTTTSATSFSVTIPAHHIKNNPAVQQAGAAFSNPSILAALQDKSAPQPLSKVDATIDEVATLKFTPSAQEQKSIFGSISTPASSTPFSSPFSAPSLFGQKTSVDKPKTDTPKTDAATKPNPFATFSFGQSPASAAAEAAKPVLNFGNIGKTLLNKDSSPVVSTSQVDSQENVLNANETANSTKDEDDEYEPNVHFEPVISLPDLVEVKTGEENEIILFEHRAKLLRYVKESKEWKERGIGNIKLMLNKDDPNKVRLLMRREQVLKLCCNQMLAKDTKFNKLPKTETAMSWFGQDFSENELQVEMFAVRFKTADLCKQFHDAVLRAQANMTEGNTANAINEDPNASSVSKSQQIAQEKPAADAKLVGFGEQFKPKAGSWSCEACYCSNKADDKNCVACNTPKDKNAADDGKSQAKPVQSMFSFGNLASNLNTAKPVAKPSGNDKAKGFGDQFKPKPGSWSCDACYTSNSAETLYCAACEEPKDNTVPKKDKGNLFSSAGVILKLFDFFLNEN